jgi:hypothetical protein
MSCKDIRKISAGKIKLFPVKQKNGYPFCQMFSKSKFLVNTQYKPGKYLLLAACFSYIYFIVLLE